MNELNWPHSKLAATGPPARLCRNERENTLGITIEHGGEGVAHCFRCGHIETNRPDAKRGRASAADSTQAGAAQARGAV